MTQNSINNKSSDFAISNLSINGNTISTITPNSDLILSPSGTGNILVTNSSLVPNTDRVDNLGNTTNSWNNLYTNSLSFDDGVNLLNTYKDYDTYTPVLSFGGNSTGITYTKQTGYYSKINNIIFFTFFIWLSSKGTSTGAAAVSLPWPVAISNNNTFFKLQCSQVDIAGYLFIELNLLNIVSNTAPIFGSAITGSANLTDANFINTSFVRTSGFYFV